MCGKKIDKCMGFVIAQDFVEYQKNKKLEIRELCGKCVFKKEKELE